jgi:enoyl-CoA hydratase/carnithine racemase
VSEEVSLEPIGDDVYEIRLQRPERMNALGVATCAALSQALSDAARKRARVVLLRGSGRAFCAGADLKERKSMDLAARLAHNAAIRAAIDAIASARFVTIACLNGLALGGGLELALGCDLRFAASGITLGLTESRVGAFPGAGGTQRLPRLIGLSRALQMMLSGEPITSEYALGIGLVNEVVAPDELEARAHAFAKMVAGRSAPALAAIKRLVYEGIELPLAAGLQIERSALPDTLGSTDYAEGLAAFAERRPPRFTEVMQ